MRKTAMLFAAAATAAISASAPSRAAFVLFGEDGDATFAAPDNNFEFGYTITHNTGVFGGEDDLGFTGTFFTVSAPGTGSGGFALIEPGLPDYFSDFLTYDWTVVDGGGGFNIATITFNFGSDPSFCEGQTTCGSFAGGPTLEETGLPQDITGLLTLPANIQVLIQSEITEAPEPATLALFGLGLIGTAIARRRAA